jgi:hypothetical protein
VARERPGNHFISVSRRGELLARRKGSAPIHVADAVHGLRVRPCAEAVARGVPSELRVKFMPGGSARDVCVTEIVVDGRDVEVAAFQRTYSVTDAELGAWMRAAVDEALDAVPE